MMAGLFFRWGKDGRICSSPAESYSSSSTQVGKQKDHPAVPYICFDASQQPGRQHHQIGERHHAVGFRVVEGVSFSFFFLLNSIGGFFSLSLSSEQIDNTGNADFHNLPASTLLICVDLPTSREIAEHCAHER